jgi:hypothetical protein
MKILPRLSRKQPEARDMTISTAQFVSENAPNARSEPARTHFARARLGVKTYSKPSMP